MGRVRPSNYLAIWKSPLNDTHNNYCSNCACAGVCTLVPFIFKGNAQHVMFTWTWKQKLIVNNRVIISYNMFLQVVDTFEVHITIDESLTLPLILNIHDITLIAWSVEKLFTFLSVWKTDIPHFRVSILSLIE